MQNTPRNKRERVRKKTQGIDARTSTVYEHRLNRRVKKVFTGLTDHTEPAAKKRHTPVEPVQSKLYPSVDPTSTG